MNEILVEPSSCLLRSFAFVLARIVRSIFAFLAGGLLSSIFTIIRFVVGSRDARHIQ